MVFAVNFFIIDGYMYVPTELKGIIFEGLHLYPTPSPKSFPH